MNKRTSWIIGGLLLLLTPWAFAKPASSIETYAELGNNTTIESPVGYWNTIDDITGETKSIIQIVDADSKLHGKVVKLYKTAQTVCAACKGENHNKPIVGMIVMTNLKKDKAGNEWANGEILDPKNGKTYHCKLQLVDEGHRLIVRGYVGLPLFGRSQTWIRVPNPEVS